MAEKILFIDRDGTLIEEPPDNQVDALQKVRLVPGVIAALQSLHACGYRFVMVSNQDGLGTDSFPTADFEACQDHVISIFESQDINFEEIFICPHRAEDGCACRKPRTGLITRYLASIDLDLDASAVIGDRDTDLGFAEAIGIRGFKLSSSGQHADSWDGIRVALQHNRRRAHIERKTRETNIVVNVNLDDTSPISTSCGIGFLDHMLEQIAKHAGFSLDLRCEGDLHIDEHHTVEDTAICLGQALREALGDKRGIGRYGFLLPMDESEAQVALDLSGRAAFQFDGKFSREAVGGLPTELVAHFFQSFAESLGAALHIRVQGENDHHMIEACFKAVGRSLRDAIRIEDRELPSTKGLLA